MASNSSHVVSVDLLRNFGQHTAVLCGIAESKGDYIVTMDDDMQNPPSEIVKLVGKIEEGYDLVFAEFEEKNHANYRKIGSRMIGYLNRKVFDKPDDLILTNFRIFNRRTAERMLNYKTNYPYIPGLLLLHAGKMANVMTKHDKREVGQSNYGLIQLIKLVSRLLFNYSSFPLRLVSGIGILVSFLSFVGGIGYAAKSYFLGVSVPGWTTIVVLLSFLLGFTLIILGIMGEYMVRMMSQLASQQPYQIRERLG